MIVGASRDESVDVVCEVESDPPAKVIKHSSNCHWFWQLFDNDNAIWQIAPLFCKAVKKVEPHTILEFG